MKSATTWIVLFGLLVGPSLPADDKDGKKHEPTAEDLSVALGMMWWIITPPPGAEGMEFGILSDGEFTVIARDEFDARSASGDVKVMYRDRDANFDLASLSDGGTLFMPSQTKPSEFRKVLNPARRMHGSHTYEFVRFQSEDRKSWNRLLVGRFFGKKLPAGKD